MRQRPNAGIMLAHRPRRWPNINPTFGQRLVFAGLDQVLAKRGSCSLVKLTVTAFFSINLSYGDIRRRISIGTTTCQHVMFTRQVVLIIHLAIIWYPYQGLQCQTAVLPWNEHLFSPGVT